MDPPWENRSVKRQKSYVMDDSVLSQIEMDSLAPNGLVVVWITNRKGYVVNCLWLRISNGEPVCSFSEFHKVPYERFVLASRPQSVSRYTSVSTLDGKFHFTLPIFRCLELFARSLLPNTVSVGFEPLLLQSSSCLVTREAKVPQLKKPLS
ncbi:unnamed protein product [Angiostrongylus costaricensis]|uniref:VHL domain-containing protein n=1 Tax=Angiostrongylus costaricensis TaxID=334426 RepID=A0A0R3PYP0_ANGCS|nr:unnamed protein product [Angiostrongylus costaricensis]